nr:3-deoxy-7-phosphoheptulonate synthase [Phenylobacterium sp.]
IAATTGNEDCHVVLRGGTTTNYDAASVAAACAVIEKSGLRPALMIDASHANSSKDPANQPKVMDDVARQLSVGERRIVGVMVESHIEAGRQDLVAGQPLVYGQSITDGCIDWDSSVAVLERLADGVRARRAVTAQGVKEGAMA